MKAGKILLAIIIVEILILSDILPIFSQKIKPAGRHPWAIESEKTVTKTVQPERLIAQALNPNALKELTAESSVEFMEFYTEETAEASIGYSGIIRHDNPSDNIFRVNIDRVIYPQDEVWLEYELRGLSGHNDVCRSINDNTSFGGLYISKEEGWKMQRERIANDAIKEGENVIRFTSFPGSNYGYKVRNLKVRITGNEKEYQREIIINQSEDKCYYNDKAYLKGFIKGPGREEAVVKAQGIMARMQGSEFEIIIDKPSASGETWAAEITAVFADGEVISKEVEFSNAREADIINSMDAEPSFAQDYIEPGACFDIQIPGAGLYAEEAPVSQQVKLSVSGLRSNDVLPSATGMVNVTGNAVGYRCLPHGMQFDKPVNLAIAWDPEKLPAGYRAEDIFTYYFDEDRKQWIRLERDSVDKENNLIISRTDHFTDFINGIIKVPESPQVNAFTPTSIKDLQVANPLDEIQLIQPPTANNMGTANLSYPLKVPPGRNGLQPNLALTYSSNNANGWMGLGWDINIPSITIETRWGVPYYDPDYESETYLLNGEQLARKDDSLEYLPLTHRADWVSRINGPVRFYPRREGAFQRIIRHGDNPKEYYWEVTTPDGTKYFYGKKLGINLIDTSKVLRDDNENIVQWCLSEALDVNGNYIRYEYQTKEDIGLSLGNQHGKQIYIKSITYTGFKDGTNQYNDGKYKVYFLLNELTYPREDIIISGRRGLKEVTARLLDRIEITFNDSLSVSLRSDAS